MDREDRRRYFIMESVIVEVVTPLMRKRLEIDYTNKGFSSLQTYINSQPVIHVLFHLRHKNVWCCVDNKNCVNHRVLPLIPKQWERLYAENPGQGRHYCHCKFTAKPIQLDDIDVTLAALILINCTNLTPNEENTIDLLRVFKNNHLSHNTKGGMCEAEFTSLWTDLTGYILQLDPSKQDELTRIQHRPLDEALCDKYCTILLDIHKRLDEMDGKLQELLDIAKNKATCSECGRALHMTQGHNLKRYKLGQSIFHLHRQFYLTSVLSSEWIGPVTDGVMMDDGRLVLCLHDMFILLICNTDGSQTDSIPVQYGPWCVTAVNNSTVAVISDLSHYIEMYDINNKHKLKSIQRPGMWCSGGITTINNKLVVYGYGELYIIDHQTGEVVQTIIKEELLRLSNLFSVPRVHATGDRIFYNDVDTNNLYCYSNSDDKHSTTTLQSIPLRITSLLDGSLYVVCVNGSVQHVSSDGKHYKPVTTEGLKSVRGCGVISYNQKQRKLFTCDRYGRVKVLHEI